MLFCFQIQLIVCSAPQHVQCVASATQFRKLFHMVTLWFSLWVSLRVALWSPLMDPCALVVFFRKPIHLEMTKASVCQTTQSAPFLPSYSIALPHIHTENTHRDTHRETHTHTHTMLLHVRIFQHACTHNAFI